MTRLPTPGGDDGTWGEILNEFLGQVHADDGSLKDGIVARAKLSNSVQSSLDAADSAISSSQKGASNGVATLTGTTLTPAQIPTTVVTKSADSGDTGKAIDAYTGASFAVVRESASDPPATGEYLVRQGDGTVTGGTAIAAVDIPAPYPGLVPVGSRCMSPVGGLVSTAITSLDTRTAHVIALDCGDLVMRFSNKNNSTTPQVGSMTVQCEIEIPTTGTFADRSSSSTRINLRFSGSTSGVIPPEGHLDSDPIGYEFSRGQVIYTQTRVVPQTPGTTQILDPGFKVSRISDTTTDIRYEDVNGNAASLIGSTSPVGTGTQPSINGYGPSAIFGRPISKPTGVVVVWGDSLSTSGTQWRMPVSDRALEANLDLPIINCAQATQTMQQFAETSPATLGFTNRMQVLGQYGTHSLFAYGTNDLGTASYTDAQIRTILNRFLVGYRRAHRRGQQVITATIPPRTTSTDSWVTAANQAVTNSNAARLKMNAWFRAGCPVEAGNVMSCVLTTDPGIGAAIPSPYVVGNADIADTVEVNASNVLTRDGGRWIVHVGGVAGTLDGIHQGHKLTTGLMMAALAPAALGLEA